MIEYKLIVTCDKCGKIVCFENYPTRTACPGFFDVMKKVKKCDAIISGTVEKSKVYCTNCKKGLMEINV